MHPRLNFRGSSAPLIHLGDVHAPPGYALGIKVGEWKGRMVDRRRGWKSTNNVEYVKKTSKRNINMKNM